ncbi:hypothetical protein [Pseudomonas sp. GV071]|uniref:hypothetical protein n=1 Tax=Pseudomonas sp. GV071 TaxID=2135754 RepID=UPI0011B1CA66|nr:hypothetical protein [Pseudomonas sp. GV071]
MQQARQSIRIQIILFSLLMSLGHSALAYDPYDCLDDVANVDPEMPIGLATELCSGSWSPEPVNCYQGASKIDEEILRGIAVELCAGSTNAGNTLECYAKSGGRDLNRGLATTLCSAKKGKN